MNDSHIERLFSGCAMLDPPQRLVVPTRHFSSTLLILCNAHADGNSHGAPTVESGRERDGDGDKIWGQPNGRFLTAEAANGRF